MLAWQKLLRCSWKSLKRTFDHLAGSLKSHGKFIQYYGRPYRDRSANLTDDIHSFNVPTTQESLEERSTAETNICSYRTELDRLRDDFKAEEMKRVEKIKEKVIKQIELSSKTDALHKKFQDMRICPRTGRWIFKRYSGVSDWIHTELPPESAIWLHAKPGYGNNIVGAVMIDKLTRYRQDGISFYYSRRIERAMREKYIVDTKWE